MLDSTDAVSSQVFTIEVVVTYASVVTNRNRDSDAIWPLFKNQWKFGLQWVNERKLGGVD